MNDYIKLNRKITDIELTNAVIYISKDPVFKNELKITGGDEICACVDDYKLDDFYLWLDDNTQTILITKTLNTFMRWIQLIFVSKLSEYFNQPVFYNDDEILVSNVFVSAPNFRTYIKREFSHMPIVRFFSFLYMWELVQTYPIIKKFI